MLPLIEGVLKGRGFTTYSQWTYRLALTSNSAASQRSAQALQESVRAFADRYYSILGEGARFYLDKTPRYSMICEELLDLVPDCRLIILSRSPAAAGRSLCTTFGGKWNTLFRYEIDFLRGFPAMARLASKNHPRVLTLRYEDLRSDENGATERVSDFLDLPLQESMDLERGRQKTKGIVGDPNASQSTGYRPLTAGEAGFLRKLVKKMPDRALGQFGYDRHSLLEEIDDYGSSLSWRDPASAIMRAMYKSGMAYAVESLFERMGDPSRRIAPPNDHAFGIE